MNKKDEKADIPPEKLLNYSDVEHACEMAIISDDPKLQKKAWDLLNRNDGEWPWMRMGILMKAYEAADAKGKEDFIMIGIEKGIKNGTLRELKNSLWVPKLEFHIGSLRQRQGKLPECQ